MLQIDHGAVVHNAHNLELSKETSQSDAIPDAGLFQRCVHVEIIKAGKFSIPSHESFNPASTISPHVLSDAEETSNSHFPVHFIYWKLSDRERPHNPPGLGIITTEAMGATLFRR